MQRTDRIKQKPLRIGASPGTAKHWIPEVLSRLRDKKVDINRINIYIGTDELTDWIDGGLIDYGIIEEKTAGPNHRWIGLTRNAVYVALNANDPLCYKEERA